MSAKANSVATASAVPDGFMTPPPLKDSAASLRPINGVGSTLKLRLPMTVRTRFAPSPTGYLHIGSVRTALFCWAYARHYRGQFILRIEDTDLERSTAESVQAILDGMRWVGLDWDEGPFFQMQRLARYREVAEALIAGGHAYRDYMSREELEALRKQQVEKGEKPRYDGRWRPERAKALGLTPPKGVAPVVRFRTPEEGVVVDDLDMDITHVIRGDDHVNNTPRQIHIFNALGKTLPQFGHLSMILGPDGERLSKRHGATSVREQASLGYLPEALVNYLARLGWSHGDAEIFSRDELVKWFDLAHVSRSAAQFNPEKLAWINQQYLKEAADARLTPLVEPELRKRGAQVAGGPALEKVVALLKDRASTIPQLADEAMLFYAVDVDPGKPDWDSSVEKALQMLRARLAAVPWERAAISEAIKEAVKSNGLKMPQLAMPLRRLVTGRTQTPSIDAVLELLGRETVLLRLSRHLSED